MTQITHNSFSYATYHPCSISCKVDIPHVGETVQVLDNFVLEVSHDIDSDIGVDIHHVVRKLSSYQKQGSDKGYSFQGKTFYTVFEIFQQFPDSCAIIPQDLMDTPYIHQATIPGEIVNIIPQ